MTTPTRAPLDEVAFTRAREEALGASAGRLLLTTVIVTLAAVAAVTVAYEQMRASELAYEVPHANPVSHYTLRSLTDDGTVVEARFWRSTAREYAVRVRAGSRAQPMVEPYVAEPSFASAVVPFARWSYVDAQGARVNDRESRHVEVEGHGRFTWSTFEEPCAGGTMTSWRLCNDDGGCITASSASACWEGPLHLVAFHEKGGTLWAVVEREMADRTARMVAGLARAP